MTWRSMLFSIMSSGSREVKVDQTNIKTITVFQKMRDPFRRGEITFSSWIFLKNSHRIRPWNREWAKKSHSCSPCFKVITTSLVFHLKKKRIWGKNKTEQTNKQKQPRNVKEGFWIRKSSKKIKYIKGILQKMEGRTSNLGKVQRHCQSVLSLPATCNWIWPVMAEAARNVSINT